MFNVRNAVQQMMSFLQQKAEYFGEDKVGREITLDDLGAEAAEVISAGRLHIQKEKDRFGRHVMYLFNYIYEQPKSVESLVRIRLEQPFLGLDLSRLLTVHFNHIICIGQIDLLFLYEVFAAFAGSTNSWVSGSMT